MHELHKRILFNGPDYQEESPYDLAPCALPVSCIFRRRTYNVIITLPLQLEKAKIYAMPLDVFGGATFSPTFSPVQVHHAVA